jgi:hypothetical protein
MRGIARRIGAAALVTGGCASGRRATHPAKSVALVPVIDATRIGEQIALFAAHIGTDLAQILEQTCRGQNLMFMGVGDMADVEGEIGGPIHQTQQDRLDIVGAQGLDVMDLQGGCRDRLAAHDEIIRLPARQLAAAGGRHFLREPVHIVAQMRNAVEIVAGIVIAGHRLAFECRMGALKGP